MAFLFCIVSYYRCLIMCRLSGGIKHHQKIGWPLIETTFRFRILSTETCYLLHSREDILKCRDTDLHIPSSNPAGAFLSLTELNVLDIQFLANSSFIWHMYSLFIVIFFIISFCYILIYFIFNFIIFFCFLK